MAAGYFLLFLTPHFGWNLSVLNETYVVSQSIKTVQELKTYSKIKKIMICYLIFVYVFPVVLREYLLMWYCLCIVIVLTGWDQSGF